MDSVAACVASGAKMALADALAALRTCDTLLKEVEAIDKSDTKKMKSFSDKHSSHVNSIIQSLRLVDPSCDVASVHLQIISSALCVAQRLAAAAARSARKPSEYIKVHYSILLKAVKTKNDRLVVKLSDALLCAFRRALAASSDASQCAFALRATLPQGALKNGLNSLPAPEASIAKYFDPCVRALHALLQATATNTSSTCSSSGSGGNGNGSNQAGNGGSSSIASLFSLRICCTSTLLAVPISDVERESSARTALLEMTRIATSAAQQQQQQQQQQRRQSTTTSDAFVDSIYAQLCACIHRHTFIQNDANAFESLDDFMSLSSISNYITNLDEINNDNDDSDAHNEPIADEFVRPPQSWLPRTESSDYASASVAQIHARHESAAAVCRALAQKTCAAAKQRQSLPVDAMRALIQQCDEWFSVFGYTHYLLMSDNGDAAVAVGVGELGALFYAVRAVAAHCARAHSSQVTLRFANLADSCLRSVVARCVARDATKSHALRGVLAACASFPIAFEDSSAGSWESSLDAYAASNGPHTAATAESLFYVTLFTSATLLARLHYFAVSSQHLKKQQQVTTLAKACAEHASALWCLYRLSLRKLQCDQQIAFAATAKTSKRSNYDALVDAVRSLDALRALLHGSVGDGSTAQRPASSSSSSTSLAAALADACGTAATVEVGICESAPSNAATVQQWCIALGSTWDESETSGGDGVFKKLRAQTGGASSSLKKFLNEADTLTRQTAARATASAEDCARALRGAVSALERAARLAITAAESDGDERARRQSGEWVHSAFFNVAVTAYRARARYENATFSVICEQTILKLLSFCAELRAVIEKDTASRAAPFTLESKASALLCTLRMDAHRSSNAQQSQSTSTNKKPSRKPSKNKSASESESEALLNAEALHGICEAASDAIALFGDFWHARGALRQCAHLYDLLVRVWHHFSTHSENESFTRDCFSDGVSSSSSSSSPSSLSFVNVHRTLRKRTPLNAYQCAVFIESLLNVIDERLHAVISQSPAVLPTSSSAARLSRGVHWWRLQLGGAILACVDDHREAISSAESTGDDADVAAKQAFLLAFTCGTRVEVLSSALYAAHSIGAASAAASVAKAANGSGRATSTKPVEDDLDDLFDGFMSDDDEEDDEKSNEVVKKAAAKSTGDGDGNDGDCDGDAARKLALKEFGVAKCASDLRDALKLIDNSKSIQISSSARIARLFVYRRACLLQLSLFVEAVNNVVLERSDAANGDEKRRQSGIVRALWLFERALVLGERAAQLGVGNDDCARALRLVAAVDSATWQSVADFGALLSRIDLSLRALALARNLLNVCVNAKEGNTAAAGACELIDIDSLDAIFTRSSVDSRQISDSTSERTQYLIDLCTVSLAQSELYCAAGDVERAQECIADAERFAARLGTLFSSDGANDGTSESSRSSGVTRGSGNSKSKSKSRKKANAEDEDVFDLDDIASSAASESTATAASGADGGTHENSIFTALIARIRATEALCSIEDDKTSSYAFIERSLSNNGGGTHSAAALGALCSRRFGTLSALSAVQHWRNALSANAASLTDMSGPSKATRKAAGGDTQATDAKRRASTATNGSSDSAASVSSGLRSAMDQLQAAYASSSSRLSSSEVAALASVASTPNSTLLPSSLLMTTSSASSIASSLASISSSSSSLSSASSLSSLTKRDVRVHQASSALQQALRVDGRQLGILNYTVGGVLSATNAIENESEAKTKTAKALATDKSTSNASPKVSSDAKEATTATAAANVAPFAALRQHLYCLLSLGDAYEWLGKVPEALVCYQSGGKLCVALGASTLRNQFALRVAKLAAFEYPANQLDNELLCVGRQLLLESRDDGAISPEKYTSYTQYHESRVKDRDFASISSLLDIADLLRHKRMFSSAKRVYANAVAILSKLSLAMKHENGAENSFMLSLDGGGGAADDEKNVTVKKRKGEAAIDNEGDDEAALDSLFESLRDSFAVSGGSDESGATQDVNNGVLMKAHGAWKKLLWRSESGLKIAGALSCASDEARAVGKSTVKKARAAANTSDDADSLQNACDDLLELLTHCTATEREINSSFDAKQSEIIVDYCHTLCLSVLNRPLTENESGEAALRLSQSVLEILTHCAQVAHRLANVRLIALTGNTLTLVLTSAIDPVKSVADETNTQQLSSNSLLFSEAMRVCVLQNDTLGASLRHQVMAQVHLRNRKASAEAIDFGEFAFEQSAIIQKAGKGSSSTAAAATLIATPPQKTKKTEASKSAATKARAAHSPCIQSPSSSITKTKSTLKGISSDSDALLARVMSQQHLNCVTMSVHRGANSGGTTALILSLLTADGEAIVIRRAMPRITDLFFAASSETAPLGCDKEARSDLRQLRKLISQIESEGDVDIDFEDDTDDAQHTIDSDALTVLCDRLKDIITLSDDTMHQTSGRFSNSKSKSGAAKASRAVKSASGKARTKDAAKAESVDIRAQWWNERHLVNRLLKKLCIHIESWIFGVWRGLLRGQFVCSAMQKALLQASRSLLGDVFSQNAGIDFDSFFNGDDSDGDDGEAAQLLLQITCVLLKGVLPVAAFEKSKSDEEKKAGSKKTKTTRSDASAALSSPTEWSASSSTTARLSEIATELQHFIVDFAKQQNSFTVKKSFFAPKGVDSMATSVEEALQSALLSILQSSQCEKRACSLALRSHDSILIIDDSLQGLPFESIPILRHQGVYRSPSLLFLKRALLSISTGESKNKTNNNNNNNNNISSRIVDTAEAAFVLNPSGDLVNSERRFTSYFSASKGSKQKTQAKKKKSIEINSNSIEKRVHWNGLIGKEPSKAFFRKALLDNDLFVYIGHNAGEKYFHPQHVLDMINTNTNNNNNDNNNNINNSKLAATFLMGCHSGRLSREGIYGVRGTALAYIAAGAPVVIGNLFDVTDRDCDKLTLRLLQLWTEVNFDDDVSGASLDDANDDDTQSYIDLQSARQWLYPSTQDYCEQCAEKSYKQGQYTPSLALHLAMARKACQLEFAVGSAAICYGSPVYSDASLMLSELQQRAYDIHTGKQTAADIDSQSYSSSLSSSLSNDLIECLQSMHLSDSSASSNGNSSSSSSIQKLLDFGERGVVRVEVKETRSSAGTAKTLVWQRASDAADDAGDGEGVVADDDDDDLSPLPSPTSTRKSKATKKAIVVNDENNNNNNINENNSNAANATTVTRSRRSTRLRK